MRKVVVSAYASMLPDAIACWYLLHPGAGISVPPPRWDLVSKPIRFWVCGPRQQKTFFYYFCNGIMCFGGTRLRL